MKELAFYAPCILTLASLVTPIPSQAQRGERPNVGFATNWCTHTDAVLHHGDFNGDGAEDLLCRDPRRLWVNYADSSGSHSWTTDWFLDTPWCTHANARFYMGDFNGDGRTDLLCKDPHAVWLDYADAQGHFAGPDWVRETIWCTHAGANFYLADFNGDGRTDLLCRDRNTMWIDYADANGRFDG